MQAIATRSAKPTVRRRTAFRFCQDLLHKLFHARDDLGAYRLTKGGCRYYCKRCVRWYEVKWKEPDGN